MENPIADIVESQITMGRNSRVPFEELCAFYAALQWQAPLPVVARASTLSIPAVYHLQAAGTVRGGQFRYRRVRAEFDRLGKAEFSTKYLTAPIRDRLRVAKAELKAGKAAVKPHLGVNPRANKHQGHNYLEDPRGGPGADVSIEFHYSVASGGDWDRTGWAWRELTNTDSHLHLRGDPRHEERPFYSSSDAREFCRLRFTPTQAEYDSEEHDRAIDDTWFWSLKKAGV
jgi:hypothetical protein